MPRKSQYEQAQHVEAFLILRHQRKMRMEMYQRLCQRALKARQRRRARELHRLLITASRDYNRVMRIKAPA
jgi:hypothetical protein